MLPYTIMLVYTFKIEWYIDISPKYNMFICSVYAFQMEHFNTIDMRLLAYYLGLNCENFQLNEHVLF